MQNAALRFGVIALICIATSCAGASSPKEKYENEREVAKSAEGQQTYSGQTLIGTQRFHLFDIDQREPNWTNPNCADPNNHDEADLCEQRKMSEAADETVFLNKVQIALGVFGTVALIYTLYLTRKSTEAAVNAANAAVLSTKAAIAIERPHVQATTEVSIAPSSRNVRTINGIPLDAIIKVVSINIGRTPACINRIGYGFHAGDRLPDTPNYSHTYDYVECTPFARTSGGAA